MPSRPGWIPDLATACLLPNDPPVQWPSSTVDRSDPTTHQKTIGIGPASQNLCVSKFTKTQWRMKPLLIWLMGWLLAGSAFAQPTQTVRGTVTDAISQMPLAEVTVLLTSAARSATGTLTDQTGRFRLTGIPTGRVRLTVSRVGYQTWSLPDLVVNAGQEVVLELALTERVTTLATITVTHRHAADSSDTSSDQAMGSSRPFQAAETSRYAGSLGDPSRMAANFAGVSGANDARNDLVVRGNSPASLLWRLEGVNIPNPNHFGSLGTTGGPVSMLNSNLLARSDFRTGAFAAEYANALGGVVDLRLRKGNDEKREFLGQMAFNGLELGAEGPYRLARKTNAAGQGQASYLVNFRYSLFGLMRSLGFASAGLPAYQDLTAKTDIPVGVQGVLTAWVLIGSSNVTFLGTEARSGTTALYGNENTNTRVHYVTGIGSLSYRHRFTARTSGKLTFSGSRAAEHFTGDTILYGRADGVAQSIPSGHADFVEDKQSLSASIAHKFSARTNLLAGLLVDDIGYSLQQAAGYPVNRLLRQTTGHTVLGQGYGQWQYGITNRLTLQTGLSLLWLGLNGSTALEPRAGLAYQWKGGQTVRLAYGLHSALQPILTYFYQTPQPNGPPALTNRGLGFTRSHHLVLGYEKQLTAGFRLKAETYYQYVFNAPVEQRPSYYSTLTDGARFETVNRDHLVNRGTGRNYGLELTLEHVFTHAYYWLITTSLFSSTYRGSDGVVRNTPFNNHYVVNLLAGREWRVGQRGNALSINGKFTTAGGRYVTPIDPGLSAAAGQEIGVYSRAFTQQQAPYGRTDLKIGYKINRRRMTQEFALDLQNLTNHANVFQSVYNPRTHTIDLVYQQSFLPIPYFRLTF
jgi:hypothetical protein